MLWKSFYAGSQIRAVQIRAMRNRASRGMTVTRSINEADEFGHKLKLT